MDGSLLTLTKFVISGFRTVCGIPLGWEVHLGHSRGEKGHALYGGYSFLLSCANQCAMAKSLRTMGPPMVRTSVLNEIGKLISEQCGLDCFLHRVVGHPMVQGSVVFDLPRSLALHSEETWG